MIYCLKKIPTRNTARTKNKNKPAMKQDAVRGGVILGL